MLTPSSLRAATHSLTVWWLVPVAASLLRGSGPVVPAGDPQPDAGGVCSAMWVGPPPKHPDDHVKTMVRDADAVVRGVASRMATSDELESLGLAKRPGVIVVGPTTAVAFDVVEVLKGDAVPNPLVIAGSLSEHDDFNADPVPYIHGRTDGQAGPCFANTYRKGAEFLFILNRTDGRRFSPYFRFPLMPVNEQLHGPDDPWLAWVRANLHGHP